MRLASMNELPHIADMAAEMLSRCGDDEFETGLQHLIDGLRAQARA